MKWFRKALYLLLVSIASSASLFAQKQDVSIRIVQEEDVYPLDPGQNTMTLQKKIFKIQVLLQNIRGVYAFASFKDSLFNLPDNQPVPGFGQLAAMTMAEEEHNKEKELILNDEGWSYWFYDPALNWHRFNKKITALDSGRVVGTKSVKQLLLLPERESMKIKENNRSLYLFFVAATENTDGSPREELLRRKIKIEWREED